MPTLAKDAANGNTRSISVMDKRFIAAPKTVFIFGEFDGGSVVLEGSPDKEDGPSSRWSPIAGVAEQTAQNCFLVHFYGSRIRANLRNGGAAMALDIIVGWVEDN